MHVHTFNVIDILPVLNEGMPECHLVLYMFNRFDLTMQLFKRPVHAHTLDRLDIRPVLKTELFPIRVRSIMPSMFTVVSWLPVPLV